MKRRSFIANSLAVTAMGLDSLKGKSPSVEPLIFRTGPWRGDVRAAFVDGEPGPPGHSGEDLAGADQRVPLNVYRIDDVKTSRLERQ